MSRISIVVTFTIKPGCEAAFTAHMRAHAAATLAEEPGCQQFDVMQPLLEDGTPDASRLMLVEMYRDMEAVRAHRANPRMPVVAAGSQPLLDGRELVMCEVESK